MSVPVLDHAAGVLLDFDGPVCAVFAGYPARDVASHLRDLAAARGIAISSTAAATDDPLAVLHDLAGGEPAVAEELDAALTDFECEAVATATPTPGAADFLDWCAAADKPVAIVSNNSRRAIDVYLTLHNLSRLVRHVQGRDPRDPSRMKPDPYSVVNALAVLGIAAASAVLIGDSTTDITAARNAGTPVIGYANKDRKLTSLASADVLITDMAVLSRA